MATLVSEGWFDGKPMSHTTLLLDLLAAISFCITLAGVKDKDCTQISHGPVIFPLFDAMQLVAVLAIIKCRAQH